ncbi:hypothetical protein EDC01DRAFT_638219 [Geopyxis carbonaria]|nr:hypothetical protein EDC01DRAFT_638219 [Geopyxis carbonaria]
MKMPSPTADVIAAATITTEPPLAAPPDFTILLESSIGTVVSTYHVHRALLSSQIHYFTTLFNSSFSDATLPTARLDASIITPAALAAIIVHIYTPTEPLPPSIPLLVDLTTAADFLQIPALSSRISAAIRHQARDPATAAAVLAAFPDNDLACNTLTANVKYWKKPALSLAPQIVPAACNRVKTSPEAIALWMHTRALERRVEASPSKEKPAWREQVFEPLKTHAAATIAGLLKDGELRERRDHSEGGFRADEIKALIRDVVMQIAAVNCRSVWEFILAGEGGGADLENDDRNGEKFRVERKGKLNGELVEIAMNWWKAQWAGCVLRGEFDKWPVEMVQDLAGRLGVQVGELLLNHTDPKEIGRRKVRAPLNITGK